MILLAEELEKFAPYLSKVQLQTSQTQIWSRNLLLDLENYLQVFSARLDYKSMTATLRAKFQLTLSEYKNRGERAIPSFSSLLFPHNTTHNRTRSAFPTDFFSLTSRTLFSPLKFNFIVFFSVFTQPAALQKNIKFWTKKPKRPAFKKFNASFSFNQAEVTYRISRAHL